MSEQSIGIEIPIETLIDAYVKMRTKKTELESELKLKIEKVDTNMKKVKTAILNHMKEIGAESMRTESGTIYRTIKESYSTTNWEAMGKFVVEHNVPELFEKRLHQGNMRVFLEEHPDLLPPGLNSNTEYSVTVKGISKKEKR